MFDFFQSGPESGDCMCPYDVRLYKSYTVKEFIDEVLKDRANEWAILRLLILVGGGLNGTKRATKKSLFCKDDKFMEKYGNHKISFVKAIGGWTRMDYDITLSV